MTGNALILEKEATILKGKKCTILLGQMTRCILASSVTQTRRERELKEKEQEPLLFQANFFERCEIFKGDCTGSFRTVLGPTCILREYWTKQQNNLIG